jgi:hypothetical protein
VFDSSATKKEFGNAVQSDGTIVRNHDRNRVEMEGGLRAGYEIIPNYYAFAEQRLNRRDYSDRLTRHNINRDSWGHETRMGADIELSGVLKGDIYMSYLKQYYDDASLRAISGPGAGTNLTWTPTPLTTVKLGVARTIGETTTQYSAGVFQTRGDLSISHELQRNIVLEANTSATQSHYRGVGRHDWLILMGGKGTYKFNRNFYAALEYQYTRQDTSAVSGQYSENSSILRFGSQF